MSARPQPPDSVELTQSLIARASLTPDDAGCQKLIGQILTPFGFEYTDLSADHGDPPVRNSWFRLGKRAPLLVFAGHTDVVPPGDLDRWDSPPFQPTSRAGWLYGRGASDMKASVAAMVCSLCRLAQIHRESRHGSLALLLTSDEEGPAIDGSRLALEKLAKLHITFDHCLIGEPTSVTRFGDTIKIGRRGSLSGRMIARGKQGHIAYPHLAINPIHLAIGRLDDFIQTPLDVGDELFEPSSLQFSAIRSGVAANVIPGALEIDFNVRFGPHYTAQTLRAELERRLQASGLSAEIEWKENPSEAFISQSRRTAGRLDRIIAKHYGYHPNHTTTGGTSDGRFIHHYCDDLVEFGPCNNTIHQINERVGVEEIIELEKIYTELARDIVGIEGVAE